jgi:NADH:ubiquinone oxidoreductase subunit E
MGAEHLRDHLCNKLKIKPGETSTDGLFTLTEVECLGSCGTAPVMLVNDAFYEELNPSKVDELIENLRQTQSKRGAP